MLRNFLKMTVKYSFFYVILTVKPLFDTIFTKFRHYRTLF